MEARKGGCAGGEELSPIHLGSSELNFGSDGEVGFIWEEDVIHVEAKKVFIQVLRQEINVEPLSLLLALLNWDACEKNILHMNP